MALEAAVRTRQRLRYGTFGRIHELTTHSDTGLEIPLPGRHTASLSIDSRGYRSPELEIPKPAGRLRVAFLGGSTTFCAEASSDAATWPAQTAALVEQALGCQVDYVNAGVAGYTTRESLTNLRGRVAQLAADVIVIYHASNDLVHDSRVAAQAAGVYREHGDRESVLGNVSLAWYLIEKNWVGRRREREARAMVSGEGLAATSAHLDIEPGALAATFEKNLEALVAAAQAGVDETRPERVVLITFATRLNAKPAPSVSDARSLLYTMPWFTPSDLRSLFTAQNDAVRSVARRLGATLVEGAGQIPADEHHYKDSIHLRDAGCSALAELVANGILESAAIQCSEPSSSGSEPQRASQGDD